MDVNEFNRLKQGKEKLVHLLKLKKKNLIDHPCKTPSRSYKNFLSVSINDEQQRCNKLVQQNRSFSLLCHSQTEEAVQFLVSCSTAESASGQSQLLSLCDREALELSEDAYTRAVERYSELLLFPQSDASQEQLHASQLEQELLALRQAFALAWLAKIRQRVRLAALEGQAEYLQSQLRPQQQQVASVRRRVDELQCQLLTDEIQQLAAEDLPQWVRHNALLLDSSVAVCRVKASLQRQDQLLCHQRLLAERLAGQRARHEVFEMTGALELAALRRVCAVAERLLDTSRDWLAWCAGLVQRCAAVGMDDAGTASSSAQQRVELELRRAIAQLGAAELVPLGSASLLAVVRDSDALRKPCPAAAQAWSTQLRELAQLLHDHDLLAGRTAPCDVSAQLANTDAKLLDVKKMISKINKS